MLLHLAAALALVSLRRQRKDGAGEVAQSVKHLPSKTEVFSFIPGGGGGSLSRRAAQEGGQLCLWFRERVCLFLGLGQRCSPVNI